MQGFLDGELWTLFSQFVKLSHKNVIFEVGHSKNKNKTSGCKVFGVSQDSTGAVKEII